MTTPDQTNNSPTRRDAIKTSAAATLAASTLASIAPAAYAQDSATIRVGLIGCGGRGTGAAGDNMRANEGTEIVAFADAFEHRAMSSYEGLKGNEDFAARVTADEDDIYTGFDAANQVIARDDIDLIIHATPPGFRPDHVLAAVKAGKHVFTEKPTCVDPAGYRKNIEAGRLAREQGTAIVTGTLYRRTPNFVEGIGKIHAGHLGQLVSGEGYYMAGGLWLKARGEDMTDIEHYSQNWLYYTFMSGDHITEQAVHNIDVLNWIMGGPPTKAYGSGGRIARTGEDYGDIYDHFSIGYEYAENDFVAPGGAHVDFKCRQQVGTATRVANYFKCTEGYADISPGRAVLNTFAGERIHQQRAGYEGYQVEHKDLVDSIRAGEPIVEIEQTADSSLTAVMGRLSAYSGQEVTFAQAQQMDLDLWPTQDGEPVTRDTEVNLDEVAIPGQYELPGPIAE